MYILDNGKFKEGIIFWDTEIDTNADVDVFFFMHDFAGRAVHKYGFKTLEINIKDLSPEEIMMGYQSRRRSQVRAALKQGFKLKFNDNNSDSQIKKYVELYNSFANFKGLSLTSFEFIKSISDDNKLTISSISKDGVVIAVHSHYVAQGRARLLHSFSTNNNFDSKTGANANKLLTHEDILYFKNKNMDTYDFGGIGNVEGDNKRFEGIIKFKKAFGGSEKIIWKGVTPNGERGTKIYNKYWK